MEDWRRLDEAEGDLHVRRLGRSSWVDPRKGKEVLNELIEAFS